MQKDTTVKASHVNATTGVRVEFELVATPLKRQGEGKTPKFYPFFKSEDQTWARYVEIFGEEFLQELAMGAVKSKIQLLYFQRSPSGEQVPVVKDGKQATILGPDGKVVVVTQKDETPRMEQFLEYLEDKNLSGREITVEYCMRKAIAIQTGTDKSFDGKSEIEKMQAAMQWITKAQEIGAAKLEKSEEEA